ncbi:unnamed protein product [Rotaria sp. Silwood2]|nr:unnamed protein product [Rotaria sp. Silwood2]CAF2945055.1 unnamed protein product [Rotaria sp. Silwood2]CAF3093703.1 unnamed protein product [Rotaria sp. Silwood2]CAF3419360.1 unnamed protein product [Rotaria sp. Silwood2]CAF3921408.1 unnamed protein product [Rotaria sp. Silwood2]
MIRSNDHSPEQIHLKNRSRFHHLIVHENKEIQHHYCPDEITSWCSYKRDRATGKHEDEGKDKNRLDPIFRQLLHKMIEDLTSKELLSRCIRGLTQNSNESLNSVVWSILSKSKHHGFSSIQGAAAAASLYFNGGRTSLLEFFKQYGIQINEDLYWNFLNRDQQRVRKADETSLKRETIILQKQKQRMQMLQASNDTTEYGPGFFH